MKVAHAVAVAVCKRRDKDLITNAVLFPTLRNGLLFVNVVISLIGNDVVLRHRRTGFEPLVRIVDLGPRKRRRTASDFALIDEPVIIAFVALGFVQNNVNVASVIYPETRTVFAAVLGECLNAQAERVAVSDGKPFVVKRRFVPARIRIDCRKIDVVHRARFVYLHGEERSALAVRGEVFPNPKPPIAVNLGIDLIGITGFRRRIDGPLLRFGMRAAQIVDVEMVFLAPVETLFVLLRHLAVGEIRFVSVLSARRKYTSEQHNERNQNA